MIPEINQIKSFIKKYIVGYDEELDILLSTIVMKTNCVMIGDVGTAKTLIIDLLTKTIKCKVFKYLLHPFIEKEELFGYLDVKTYRETGKRVFRTEGYLPEANIVFFDEVFKAPPSVRHMLLDLLMFRRVSIDGRIIHVPLYAMYGASNEIPTEKEDQAFWDRMTFRIFVKGIDETQLDELYMKSLKLEIEKPLLNTKPIIDISSFDKLHEEYLRRLEDISISEEIKEAWKKVLVGAKELGIVVSPRRATLLLKSAVAYSIVVNDPMVEPYHLATVSKYVLANTPEEVPKIEQKVRELGIVPETEILKKIDMLITEGNNLIEYISKRIREKKIDIKDKIQIDNYLTKAGNVIEEASKLTKIRRRTEIKLKLQTLDKIVNKLEELMGEIQ